MVDIDHLRARALAARAKLFAESQRRAKAIKFRQLWQVPEINAQIAFQRDAVVAAREALRKALEA